MKAVRYHEFGDHAVLRFEDIEQPVPGAGEVLVEVAATSFNPVDDHIRAGHLNEMIPIGLPHVPGIDLAGTLAELGSGVSGRRVGEQVVVMLPLDAVGAAAEYVVVPAETVVTAPRTIDLVDAASLPLVGLAAWQALFELAKLEAGQSVLIIGAGGAVGSIAVQLAVDAGARVTASASARHRDRLASYGVDRVVGPTDGTAAPAELGGPFDVVVNLVRFADDETAARLSPYVADGGVAVSTGTPIPEEVARSTRSGWVFVRPDSAALAELVHRVDTARLLLHVADRRPLQDLAIVHQQSAVGALVGKTVLTLA